jgi:hypothetical protein
VKRNKEGSSFLKKRSKKLLRPDPSWALVGDGEQTRSAFRTVASDFFSRNINLATPLPPIISRAK